MFKEIAKEWNGRTVEGLWSVAFSRIYHIRLNSRASYEAAADLSTSYRSRKCSEIIELLQEDTIGSRDSQDERRGASYGDAGCQPRGGGRTKRISHQRSVKMLKSACSAWPFHERTLTKPWMGMYKKSCNVLLSHININKTLAWALGSWWKKKVVCSKWL